MDYNNLIVNWRDAINEHSNLVKDFIRLNKQNASDYEKSKKEVFDIGFNVFTLSSDFYYRENFHSDIIKAFLDPHEKHLEKSKYLYLFIGLLNMKIKNPINKFDFENAIVIRERNNIDILIVDEVSKKAIIIENKINNAVDQRRQLPTYYEKISENYTVEAIVYLTINLAKQPDKHDWTADEIKEINSILMIIPAWDKSALNLYTNWIVPCIIESKNSESLFLLQQYGNLIKHLSSQTMDTIALEKFYTTLKENNNLDTTISIRNMLNDLPQYMAIRIEDRFKNNHYPFSRIWRHQLRDCVFECFKMENYEVKIDVWCDEYGYKIHVWSPRYPELDIKENLPSVKSISDFVYYSEKSNNVFKTFSFFEEELVFNFIEQIIAELKSL